MIGRRALVVALGGAAAAVPLAARAQPKAMPRLVFLWPGPAVTAAPDLRGLQAGLRDLGYEEGRTLAIDYRYADGSDVRLAELAAAAVTARPDAIFTVGAPGLGALARVTRTVPVVAVSGDLVADGAAASIARPGGNVTGMTVAAGPELAEKWLELLLEIVPRARRIAVLRSARDRLSAGAFGRVETMADRRGNRLEVGDFVAGTAADIPATLASVGRAAPNALIVQLSPILLAKAADIAALGLPAISGDRKFADAGLLMSYGADIPEIFRRCAGYIDRILKGASPGDLPIEQPTKFELVVNQKTARALGLVLPPTLLARADEVIE
jgi:putative tryptophan/tyrosine transport system substrate-binding protein